MRTTWSALLVCALGITTACAKEMAPGLSLHDAGRVDLGVLPDGAMPNDSALDAPIPDASVDATVDAPIDMGIDAPAQTLVDFTLSGEDFFEYEATTVNVLLEDRSFGRFSSVGTATVASGAFSITMEDAFDRALFGMGVHIYIDADLDLACNAESDPVWEHLLLSDSGTGPMTLAILPTSTELTPGTCDLF